MSTGIYPPQPTAAPPTAKMTAEEFAKQFSGRYAELINGIPVESPMPVVQQAPQPTAAPPTAKMTAEEFAKQFSGRYAELINGIPVELPMPGFNHGDICFRLAFEIGGFVVANKLGRILTNDSFVRVSIPEDPERVRGADVSFFSYERVPRGESPIGIAPVSPNLVGEVKSPSDTWSKVHTKIGEYLGAGVAVVVIVDPPTQTVMVFREDAQNPQQTLKTGEDLTLPDVLPGFSMPVARLFA